MMQLSKFSFTRIKPGIKPGFHRDYIYREMGGDNERLLPTDPVYASKDFRFQLEQLDQQTSTLPTQTYRVSLQEEKRATTDKKFCPLTHKAPEM